MAYIVMTAALVLALATCQISDAKKVVGWVEKVSILPENVIVTAKIDTGADNSCLDVRTPTMFERGGEQWIRFELPGDGVKRVTVERKVVRMAEIKRHKGKPHQRPVVKMTICLGDVKRVAEINLMDRSRFRYRMLIGRSFLQGEFSVDPSVQLTVEPVCEGAEDT